MNQLGQYHIERLVSTGGMSTLYLGRHREMGRQVVLKQLHPHLARDEALVRRFEREARILGGLRHPNIVDIIDFFQHQGSYYIVLEYIEGCSLKELLERRSPLPVTVAAFVAGQLANGLGYAHGRGVVHRDIKPANIMFTASGLTKIADFGLAFVKETLAHTDPGTFFGTPAYLAPEQIQGSKGDERSDLFSLGVVLYQALSGANPFAGGSHSESIDRVLRMRPPRLSAANPGVPPGLESLISDFIEKDPERRPAGAVQTAERLEPYIFISGDGLARFLADPEGYQPRREDQQALERVARRERRARAAVRLLAYSSMALGAAAAVWAGAHWGLPAFEEWRLRQRPVTVPAVPDTAAVDTMPLPLPAAGQRLRVSGTTGAGVSVDGSLKGSIPLSIEGIPPGRHRIRAELEGYQPFDKTVTIVQGKDLELAVNLEPAVREPGYLALAVSPWAEVFVDGRLVDRTPLSAPIRLEAGKRQLVLRHPNRREYSREITIEPGDTLSLRVVMPQAWGYLSLSVAPWAEIFVDGEASGTTPLAAPLRLSIGEHELRLSGPGGREWRETVRISEGDTLGIRVDLQ